MTKLQTNIRDFMVKAGQIVREKPSELTKEEAELRVRLVFEEAFELANALGVSIHNGNRAFSENDFAYQILDTCYDQQDITLAADAIADLNYVVNGTAVAMGIDMEPIDEEVHDSNMSKFIDGYRREDGKWVKGPSYRPANIKALIEKQQNA